MNTTKVNSISVGCDSGSKVDKFEKVLIVFDLLATLFYFIRNGMYRFYYVGYSVAGCSCLDFKSCY